MRNRKPLLNTAKGLLDRLPDGSCQPRFTLNLSADDPAAAFEQAQPLLESLGITIHHFEILKFRAASSVG